MQNYAWHRGYFNTDVGQGKALLALAPAFLTQREREEPVRQ